MCFRKLYLFTTAGPSDYTALNVPLTFTPGTITRQVLLQTNDDSNVENQEQLTASLSVDNNIYPGVTIGSGPATIDIIDNDGKCLKSINALNLIAELEREKESVCVCVF